MPKFIYFYYRIEYIEFLDKSGYYVDGVLYNNSTLLDIKLNENLVQFLKEHVKPVEF
jgi:hypothetical protein